MAESVYKIALWWFKEKEGRPGTHKILSNEEYKILTDSEKSLKRELEENKEFHLEEIDNLIDEYENEIENLKIDYEKLVKKLKTQVLIAMKHAADQKDLNDNLLKISKERSNQERNLQQTKEHTGYVVVASQEKELEYRRGNYIEKIMVWETTIQTPYSIKFTEMNARNQIFSELLTKEKGFLLGKIGIKQQYNISVDKLMKEKKKEILENNTIFSQRLKASYTAGFWEYIMLHTLPLSDVPQEML